jgi:hypothetical protein
MNRHSEALMLRHAFPGDSAKRTFGIAKLEMQFILINSASRPIHPARGDN